MSLLLMAKFVHVLQVERYHGDAYLKWVMEGGGLSIYSGRKFDKPVHFVSLAMMASAYFSPKVINIELVLLTSAAVYWTAFHIKPESDVKKALVVTARVQRLLFIAVLLEAVFLRLMWGYGMRTFVCSTVLLAYMQPFFIALANFLGQPVEKIFQYGFKKEAMKKVAGKKVIAVTGSYGKTGTKEAIAHLIETSFPVIKTPGSFNTPMGLCRVINDGLEPHHEIFVTEMGATRVGDIKELCEIVHPSIGVITSIGDAHMESFKTEENVASTKFELADALPPEGVIVYNSDYPSARERVKGREQEIVSYGLDPQQAPDYIPGNIRCSSNGSTFDLRTPDGVIENINIRLLGKLNVLNVSAGFAVGRLLGISPERLKNAASSLPQMEARLELIQIPGSYLMINDGFNSNLAGAKEAVETLSYFENMKKILVTPGIVDLGRKHEVINFDFGKSAAKFCDEAILVNERRTKPLRNGLMAGKMPAGSIRIFSSLADARRFIDETAGAGCVVLFENDLPDHMEAF
jgi:UDP-N-acetylmuramoyl-tripeptide--D-alanyl-D-alanine ligase